MTVSLVLPCYNPPNDWEQIVYNSFTVLCNGHPEISELIVVLDGESASITPEAISFLTKKVSCLHVVRYQRNRGKGYAIRQGVEKATGDIIIYTDIDFPYTNDSIIEVLRVLKSGGCDVAVGVKNALYYSHVPPVRRAVSKFLRFLISIFLSMPITDTQCGLKGFTRPVKPLFLKTTIDRYLFDLEFIRNCFRSKKFRVQAIPVNLRENVKFRKMNYRILLLESINFMRLLLHGH